MIRIQQIYYKQNQNKELDPTAIPYFNKKNDLLYEYGVMRSEYLSNKLFKTKDIQYEGFISWKWKEKTNVSVQHFIDCINDCPSYDCYAMNPFSWVVHLNKNIWTHGEICHPTLLILAQALFNNLGYNINLKDQIHTINNCTTCNYWVGTKECWDKYIQFIEPFSQLMIGNKEIYFPLFYQFIMERLWTEFISIHNIKAKIFSLNVSSPQ